MADDINVSIDESDNVNVSVSPSDSIQINVTETNFGTLQTSDTSTINLTFANNTLSADFVPTSNVSLASNKLVDVADPTLAQDAATKAYVDAQVSTENLWDRSGTTLSPHTIGDTIDVLGLIKSSRDGTPSQYLSMTAGTATGPVIEANGVSKSLTISNSSTGGIYFNTIGFGQALYINNSGATNVLLTTDSTSSSTGALIVSGGVGIAKNLVVDTNTLYVDATTHKVGIGTTTPSARLDVQAAGDTKFFNFEPSSTLTGYVYGHIKNSGGTTILGTEGSATGNMLVGSLSYASVLGSVGSTALQFGTNQIARMTILPTSGNVGIGTTSPGVTLEVAGVIKTTNTTASTSTTTGALVVAGGVGISGALYTGSSASFAGNVGIGTTTPDHRLDIAVSGGTTAFGSNSAAIEILNTSSSINVNSGLIFSASAGGSLNRYAGVSGIVTGQGSGGSIGDIIFSGKSGVAVSSLSEYMRITSSGNVGIGTASPSQKLEVASANAPAIALSDTTWATVAPIVKIVGDNAGANWNDGFLAFHTHSTDNSSLNEVMRIQGNGNVGIGTTNPSKKLQIDTGTSGSTNGIRLTYNTSTTEGLDLQYTNTGQTSVYMDSLYNSDSAAMYFRMKTASTPVNALTILGSGKVGVGITSPSYKLSVASSNVQVHFSAAGADSGGYLISTTDSQAILAAGLIYNGAGWTAKATNASMVYANAGAVTFYGNTGLTVGSSFTPTERMNINSSGDVNIASTSASTSTTTGALVVTGGVGASGAIYAGGQVSSNNGTVNAYLIASGTAGYVGTSTTHNFVIQSNSANRITVGATTGDTTILSTTASTSSTTGALIVSGGVGITGEINAVSGTVAQLKFNSGSLSLTPSFAVGNSSGSGKFAGLVAGTAGSAFIYDEAGTFYIQTQPKSDFTNNTLGSGSAATRMTISGAGLVNIPSTQASTSTTTGALTIAGGLGVAKAGYFGDTVNISTSNNNSLVVESSGASYPNVRITNNTATYNVLYMDQNTSTASRVVLGQANGSGSASWANAGVVGTTSSATFNIITADTKRISIAAGGDVTIVNTTASSSTTTGALIVSGGVGVAKEIRAGGLIFPQQATTAGAPTYVLGAIYFDTTLNKLRVGGATGWETVTSV